jgi:hypothetical protein
MTELLSFGVNLRPEKVAPLWKFSLTVASKGGIIEAT